MFTATSKTSQLAPAGPMRGLALTFLTLCLVTHASASNSIVITAPGNGSNADQHTDLSVTVNYASGGGGYQTPTWAYRIDSGFPGYGSPHGGTQVTGVTNVNDFLSGQANGMRQVNVALLDQGGNLHNPPIVHTVSVNYQSGGGGYQSGGGGNQHGNIGVFDFTVRSTVDLNNSTALKALVANHQSIYFQVYMDDQNVSYDSTGKKTGNGIWALSIENATGGQSNMIVDMSGNVYHGDYSTYWFRAHGIETWNNPHWHESSYSTTSTGIDSLLMAHPVINDPHALIHTIKPFDFMPDGQANLSSQSALLMLSENYESIYFQKYHFPETTASTGTHDGFINPLDIVAGGQRYQSGGGNYQSGGGHYQSGGGGFFPYTGPYTSPTHDLRIDTRNALFDDHIEFKNLNSVAKLKADYNTTQAFNDSINALVDTLPTLPAPPSTSRGDAIDNWIKVEFETVKVLDPKKEAAFVWVLSLEEANNNGSNKVIDMHGNIYETDYESYWLSVYGVATHKDPNWSEVEYQTTSAGIAKLIQDHPFVDPGVAMETMHKLAVLETDTPQVQGNVIQLSGSLLDTNGTDVMQIGFLVSSHGHPFVNDPHSQVILATAQNNLISASYTVPSGGVYFVRTFAETKGGISEGPVRKIEIFLDDPHGNDPQATALSIIREGTVELAGGWRQSQWFGLYLDHGNGWVYHQAHGWLYMVHDGQDGIWTWHQQRGWLWTRQNLYPYLYESNTANWLYLLGGINGQAVFFNYGTNSIEL